MAIDNTVGMWNENAGAVYNAREYRRLLERLMAYDVATSPGTGAGGVFRPADLAVAQNGTPNMTVIVAAGAAYVDGSQAGTQGGYFVYNDAQVSVTIPASDITNGRIDIIGVQVTDSEYAGATNTAAIVLIQGTAAPSPLEPALPANFVTLARVDVPANDTAITTSQITDRRRRMAALGGQIACTSITRPTVNLWQGLTIFETDTLKALVWDGSTWVESLALGAWNTYSTTWATTSAPAALGNGVIFARYRKVGRTVTFMVSLRFGATTNGGTGGYTFTLPFQAASGPEQFVMAKAFTNGPGNYAGWGYMPALSTTVAPYFPNSASTTVMSQVRNSTSGVVGQGIPQIGGAYTFTDGFNIWVGGTYESAN